jgi:hypothetical protein
MFGGQQHVRAACLVEHRGLRRHFDGAVRWSSAVKVITEPLYIVCIICQCRPFGCTYRTLDINQHVNGLIF